MLNENTSLIAVIYRAADVIYVSLSLDPRGNPPTGVRPLETVTQGAGEPNEEFFYRVNMAQDRLARLDGCRVCQELTPASAPAAAN